MKVLMIEHFLPESSYTLELGKELKNQTELTVFCRKGAASSLDGIQWKDQLYEGGKNKLCAVVSYPAGLIRLEHEIHNGHYDIIHVQTFKNAAYEIPIYLHAKKHCRYLVHTVHNLLPHEAVKSDRDRYLRFYHACDLLIVHNEHCKRLLMEQYHISEKKICVTPHGAYTMVEKKRAQSQEETVNFLQFGILRKYKGIDILFQALSRIPEELRDKIHVTVAGAQFSKLDPTDYQSLANDLGISNMVTLRIGHVPDEHLSELFDSADFCLFPYRNIYGSGALLMAYSYGKPVIASNIPVFAEETENGAAGILFSSENPESLKDAILQAATWKKEQYRTCADRIQTLVHEKYSWKNSAAILTEAYKSLWETDTAKTQL